MVSQGRKRGGAGVRRDFEGVFCACGRSGCGPVVGKRYVACFGVAFFANARCSRRRPQSWIERRIARARNC